MKRIYLCALAISVGYFAFGQRVFDNAPLKARKVLMNEDYLISEKTKGVDKAPGDVIWSEDFTNGIPANWTIVDNTGNNYNWVINNATIDNSTTGPGFTNATPVASTSGGNHILLWGDDYNNGAGNTEMDAYFQTDSIPLTGQASVTVRFEQKFRLCCSQAAALNLMVSTDPNFATNVDTFDVRRGIPINFQSADPFVTVVNISNVAGGLNGNIYLRFHWASGASHYYWMVDDIEVIESENNDIYGLESHYGSQGFPYTRIPVAQIQPIDFIMAGQNVGGLAQPNARLTAEVEDATGVIFTGTSAPILQQPLSIDTFETTTQFTPPTTLGIPYNVTLTLGSDSTDNTPDDNIALFAPFEVSEFLYAYDNFGQNPGNGGGEDMGVTEYEAGNFYDIVANQTAYSVNVYIGDESDIGTTIDVGLYEVTQNGFVQIGRSLPYQLTNVDIIVTPNLILPFITPAALTAGTTVFACVHAYGGAQQFSYGTSGISIGNDDIGGANAVSLIYYPNMVAPNQGQRFFTTQTPMVRLNFDPVIIGIEEVENATNFNVYPNPSKGQFNININSEVTDNVELSVKNVLGQVVISKTIAVSGYTTETISLEGHDQGIYFLTIGEKTSKLILD